MKGGLDFPITEIINKKQEIVQTFLNFDSFSLEQFSKFLDFLLKFTDKLSICVFIDNSFAYNLFSTISVSVGFVFVNNFDRKSPLFMILP